MKQYLMALMMVAAIPAVAQQIERFERIATFDVDGEVAEIMAATPDGRTVVYTDSEQERIGFVDLSDPPRARQTGTLAMPGEPTSVAVTPDGQWALVAVDGDEDILAVASMATRTIVHTMSVAGQPDSVGVSPDGRYAVVVIENERDEDLNEGRMPQLPAGLVQVVTIEGAPAGWTMQSISLTGLAGRFPEDPEPEFVDINASNIAAVTLQENNHIVLIDLATATVTAHFPAGTTSHAADVKKDGDIRFDGTLVLARREPDGIVWTRGGRLVTANEGDYTVDLAAGEFAGSRDFTIFSADGTVVYEPGAALEQEAARVGHYPDSRSRSKGIEVEGVETGVYGGRQFLFAGSERGDFVAVYGLDDEAKPVFVQILPTGDAPEGLLALPGRNLFLTSNEDDGSISIFEGRTGDAPPSYPQVVSEVGGWGALSGLAHGGGQTFYAVPDSAMAPSRILTIDMQNEPARITSVVMLSRAYDLEGIARIPGGWWVVSEGSRNAGDAGATKNLLIRVDEDGTIAQEIELPASVNAQQKQFGFEGVATNQAGTEVFVAFQREWGDDPAGRVKIGRYMVAGGEWRFYHYPLDAAPAGGWVGLSEISRLSDTMFAVIERDNQQRDEASVKRIYTFSIEGLTPAAAGASPPLLAKTLMRDLKATDDWRLEKAEGMAFTPARLVIASDNDGAGETRILRWLRTTRIWPRR